MPSTGQPIWENQATTSRINRGPYLTLEKGLSTGNGGNRHINTAMVAAVIRIPRFLRLSDISLILESPVLSAFSMSGSDAHALTSPARRRGIAVAASAKRITLAIFSFGVSPVAYPRRPLLQPLMLHWSGLGLSQPPSAAANYSVSWRTGPTTSCER